MKLCTIGAILFIIFLVLKLCNVLNIRWFWVFFPLWLPLVIDLVFDIIYVIIKEMLDN